MDIELSAHEAHITGYVNVVERQSRPVMTPHGKSIEVIEMRAFDAALQRGGEITCTVDHNKGHVYASTIDGTLSLREDSIGLHADVTISDANLIELARKGEIKGWSFGMNVVDEKVEQRAEALPLRRIRALVLDHVSLIVKKFPVYSATSVELRANETDETDVIELRAFACTPRITVCDETPHAPSFDNSAFHERIQQLNKKEK